MGTRTHGETEFDIRSSGSENTEVTNGRVLPQLERGRCMKHVGLTTTATMLTEVAAGCVNGTMCSQAALIDPSHGVLYTLVTSTAC